MLAFDLAGPGSGDEYRSRTRLVGTAQSLQPAPTTQWSCAPPQFASGYALPRELSGMVARSLVSAGEDS